MAIGIGWGTIRINCPVAVELVNLYIHGTGSGRGANISARTVSGGGGSLNAVNTNILVSYQWFSSLGNSGTSAVTLPAGNNSINTGLLADPGDTISSIYIYNLSPSNDGTYAYIINNY